MALITIDGHIGAHGGKLGRRVAKMLDLEYVDRLVLPDAENFSQLIVEKPRLSERLWSALEKAVRGVALGNAAGDPYFAGSSMMMLPLTWDASPDAPMASSIPDGHDHPHSLQHILKKGKAVLVQRAGAVALKGHEQVVKIGVFASWEDRIRNIMNSQGLSRAADAERIIRFREEAQKSYFESVHSANPEDESLYDLCINTSQEQVNVAALKVSRAVKALQPLTA